MEQEETESKDQSAPVYPKSPPLIGGGAQPSFLERLRSLVSYSTPSSPLLAQEVVKENRDANFQEEPIFQMEDVPVDLPVEQENTGYYFDFWFSCFAFLC
jgi:hypothetical protein